MIRAEDIREFLSWLRPWALALGAIAVIVIIASGIGQTIVTTGELASMLGGRLN